MDQLGTTLLLFLLALGASGQTNNGLNQRDLIPFLQPDTVGDRFDSGHEHSRRCDRECVRGARPRLCYYKFTVEDYHTLGAACGLCPSVQSDCDQPQCVAADGNERGLLTANRMLPGPSIQVCLGDRVVVDILNVMPGRSTAIHFHGVLQEDTNAMDGVPMVTQCPVPEGATFRYDFRVKNEGTHFWHSHDGFQKMDGLQGSLIVRKPRALDPNSLLYDEDLPEHVILLTDWFETDSDQKFPGLRRGAGLGQEPVSYLINGRGRVSPPISTAKNKLKHGYGVKSQHHSVLMDVVFNVTQSEEKGFGQSKRATPPEPTVPLSTFTVRHGRRYRFRLIGGTCAHCPAEVSIAQHRMRVIAADGNAVKAVYVDRIVVLPGERYDFILDARQARSAYWIQVRGLGPCMDRNTSGVAVLKYRRSLLQAPPSPDPEFTPVNPQGLAYLNPVDSKCGPNDHNVCVNQLESLEWFDTRLLQNTPDHRLEFNFDFKLLTVEETFRSGKFQRFLQPIVPVLVTAHMNNISNVLGGSPLLTQYHDIPPELFCPASGCAAGDLCDCLHIVKVPLNALVEMVFADATSPAGVLTHPFHVHGHKFIVLDIGQFPDAKNRHWTPSNATEHTLSELRHGRGWFTAKDTIAVPAAGYAVIRFLADNPGFWMVHCHYIYHQAIGMHLVLQVGELDEMPSPPPGFPTCGNFVGRVNVAPYH